MPSIVTAQLPRNADAVVALEMIRGACFWDTIKGGEIKARKELIIRIVQFGLVQFRVGGHTNETEGGTLNPPPKVTFWSITNGRGSFCWELNYSRGIRRRATSSMGHRVDNCDYPGWVCVWRTE